MLLIFFKEQLQSCGPVKNIKCGNEELVGVLLLIPGQVPRMGPYQMQEPVQRQRRFCSRVELLKLHKSK